MNRIFLRLLLVLCPIGAGVWLLSLGSTDLAHGFASRSWPAVEGTIVRRELETYKTSAESGPSTLHRIIVSYDFSVYGYTYQGNRLRFRDAGFGSPREAHEYLGRLVHDSRCQVFYQPNDPNESTLVTVVRAGALVECLLLLAVGVVLVALGVYVAWKTDWLGSLTESSAQDGP